MTRYNIVTSLCALILSSAYLTVAEIQIRTTTVSEDGHVTSLHDWVPLKDYYPPIAANLISSGEVEKFVCYENLAMKGSFLQLPLVSKIEVAVRLELLTGHNIYELVDPGDYDVDGMILWKDSNKRCSQDSPAEFDIQFADWGNNNDMKKYGVQYLDDDRMKPIQLQYAEFDPPVKLEAFRLLNEDQQVLTKELYQDVTKIYADFEGEEREPIPDQVDVREKWKTELTELQAKELGYDQGSSLADKILNNS